MKNTLNILLFLLAGTLVSDNCDAFRHRKISKNTTQQQVQQQQQPNAKTDRKELNDRGTTLSAEGYRTDDRMMNDKNNDLDDIINGTFSAKKDVKLNPNDLFDGLDDVNPEKAGISKCKKMIEEISIGCDKSVIEGTYDELCKFIRQYGCTDEYYEAFAMFLCKYQSMAKFPEMQNYCWTMEQIAKKYPDKIERPCFNLMNFDKVNYIVQSIDLNDLYSCKNDDNELILIKRCDFESKILDIE